MSDMTDKNGNTFAAADVIVNDPTLASDHNGNVETAEFFTVVKAGIFPGNDQSSPGAGNPDIVHIKESGHIFHAGFVRLDASDSFAIASDDVFGGAAGAFAWTDRIIDVSLIGFAHVGDISDDEIWPGGSGEADIWGDCHDSVTAGTTRNFFLHRRWFTGTNNPQTLNYTGNDGSPIDVDFVFDIDGNDFVVTAGAGNALKCTICVRVELSPKMTAES